MSVVTIAIVLAATAFGQAAPPAARDPQALSLLSQSLAAMTKGPAIQDIKIGRAHV